MLGFPPFALIRGLLLLTAREFTTAVQEYRGKRAVDVFSSTTACDLVVCARHLRADLGGGRLSAMKNVLRGNKKKMPFYFFGEVRIMVLRKWNSLRRSLPPRVSHKSAAGGIAFALSLPTVFGLRSRPRITVRRVSLCHSHLVSAEYCECI